jgi:hypothetical protein
MKKSKSTDKAKPYQSPWRITDKNIDYYKQSFHRPGGQPPLDFSKLETRTAKVPGMGVAWLNRGDILNQKKILKKEGSQ